MRRRTIAIGIALALLVAIPLVWGVYRQHELLTLLEKPPDLSFRLENARELHDRFLASRAWQTVEGSAAYASFQKDARGREFESVRHGLTVVLDDDPIELLLRTFGRRVLGALWIRPTGGVAVAMISLPEEGTEVKDLAKRLQVLSKTNKRIRVDQVEGMAALDVGGDVMLLGNGVVTWASSEAMALRVAREWKQRLGSDAPGTGALHLRIDPRVARLTDPGPARNLRDLASMVLTGGLAASLREATEVTGSLAPTDDGLALSVRLDAGLDVLDERMRMIYAPAQHVPGPTVPGEILRAHLARDLEVLWQDRRARLTPDTFRSLGEIEEWLRAPALFGGLFTGFEPGFTLHVAPQTWNEDWPEPESPFPGVAISARMREPEQTAYSMTRAFESLVQLANEEPANRHQPPLLLGEVEGIDGVKLLRARFAVPPAGGPRIPATTRNVTPAIAHRESTFVLASSASLARDLVTRAAPEPVPNTPRDTLHLDAANLAEALRAARVALVQNQVEQGVLLERAEQDVEALIAIVDAFGSLDAEVVYGADETRIAVELRAGGS